MQLRRPWLRPVTDDVDAQEYVRAGLGIRGASPPTRPLAPFPREPVVEPLLATWIMRRPLRGEVPDLAGEMVGELGDGVRRREREPVGRAERDRLGQHVMAQHRVAGPQAADDHAGVARRLKPLHPPAHRSLTGLRRTGVRRT